MEQELAEAAEADPMAGRHLIDVCPSHQHCVHACCQHCLLARQGEVDDRPQAPGAAAYDLDVRAEGEAIKEYLALVVGHL